MKSGLKDPHRAAPATQTPCSNLCRDEKRTESQTEKPDSPSAPVVATYAAMKSGLKARHRGGLERPCHVATYAAMKSGLKETLATLSLRSHTVATYAAMKSGLKDLIESCASLSLHVATYAAMKSGLKVLLTCPSPNRRHGSNLCRDEKRTERFPVDTLNDVSLSSNLCRDEKRTERSLRRYLRGV